MLVEFGVHVEGDAMLADALRFTADRIAKGELKRPLPDDADEVARWVYTAVGGSDADSVAHGVPSWFRTGVIGGLLQAFDVFIAGTADDDNAEVVAMHDAAVRISGMFRGDVPPEVG